MAGKIAKKVWFRTILTVENIDRCHEFKEGWEDKLKAGRKDVFKRDDETPRIEESESVVPVRDPCCQLILWQRLSDRGRPWNRRGVCILFLIF